MNHPIKLKKVNQNLLTHKLLFCVSLQYGTFFCFNDICGIRHLFDVEKLINLFILFQISYNVSLYNFDSV